MFMYSIKDKQTIDFLFKGQEDSYAYFKNLQLKFRSWNFQLK